MVQAPSATDRECQIDRFTKLIKRDNVKVSVLGETKRRGDVKGDTVAARHGLNRDVGMSSLDGEMEHQCGVEHVKLRADDEMSMQSTLTFQGPLPI